jgi:hypothetical protein
MNSVNLGLICGLVFGTRVYIPSIIGSIIIGLITNIVL